MTCRIDPSEASANQCAFLDMLACSEIGAEMMALSDDGYNVLVGSRPHDMLTFDSYATHPNILHHGANSTAAGRYQLLHRYYVAYTKLLGLHDFSPLSQDKIALQQIKECRALPLIDAGNFDGAVSKCKHIWASLPGAGYGQHENSIGALRYTFVLAGGMVS